MELHCSSVQPQTESYTTRRATWSQFEYGVLPRLYRRSVQYIALAASLLFLLTPVTAGLYEDRSNYRQAKHALELGRISEYNKLRALLDDYVLTTYLDYYREIRRVGSMKPEEAQQIRQRLADYSVGDRFFRHWLNQQARSKRWQTYADYYEPSQVVEEQCHYLQALFHVGRDEAALHLVPDVWVYGKSQPKVCDMPFNRWIQAKRVTDQVAWDRLELALGEDQTTLARYLLRFFTSEARPSADGLVRVDRNPQLTRNRHNFENDQWGRAALRFGLFKLTRSDAVRADQNWRSLKAYFNYTQEEQQMIEDELAFWLSREDVVPTSDTDFSLFSVRTLSSILDTLISQENWVLANQLMDYLPEDERTSDKWRYWQGIVQERLEGSSTDTEKLRELASERHYYGFLAASHLDLPSQLNAGIADSSDDYQTQVMNDRRIDLIMELFAVGDSANARTEWRFLQGKLSKNDKMLVVQRFAEVGLTYDAIYTANDAGANDVLDVRFPMPYLHEYRRQSHETNVPIEFLLGITRQESAFHPSAVSPMGARGLMQLMPTTASATASRLRVRRPSSSSLLLPHINIQLGAHHVAELLEDFNQNRILVLAAYNAGSSNVRRWLPRDNSMNTLSWIERIPFYETRSYVKSVLAFTHVYALLMNHESPMIQGQEMTIQIASAY